MELGEPCSAHKASTAERTRNEQRLRKVLVGSNTRCADCGAPVEFRNAWASINLGVFCCIQCSGIHRQLGVHITKVRAVAADDWNDDWVDNMEKWGNARANEFWEAAPPPLRPAAIAELNSSTALTKTAERGMIDFIRAKYQHRTFQWPGITDPLAWHAQLALPNGWCRHYDGESKAFFYARGDETVWEMPAEAAVPPPPPAEWWAGHEGWLEKKSGGKEGVAKAKLFQKWDRRYFVLGTQATLIVYYKSDEAFRKREAPLGSVSLNGGSGFVKEVKKDVTRFTILTKERELKLRTPSADFRAWAAALFPVLGDITQTSRGPAAGGGAAGDDDDDD